LPQHSFSHDAPARIPHAHQHDSSRPLHKTTPLPAGRNSFGPVEKQEDIIHK